MDWTHSAAAISAAFLGSLVEFVEALTIILAVGITRGWKAAWAGAAAGVAALVALVAALGSALARVPIHALQIVVGMLLLLFGMRWLRKAILRSGGAIRLRDEDATFARETRILSTDRLARRAGVDPLGFVTAFKAVLLEGVEVAFIVVAVGSAGGMLVPAGLGALAALALVALAGLALHRPLARVPENTLKFSVGVLISAFGIFWLGEGVGADWPGEDLILFPLIAVVAGASLVLVAMVRRIMADEAGA
jgi:uncharacterized membrane protein